MMTVIQTLSPFFFCLIKLSLAFIFSKTSHHQQLIKEIHTAQGWDFDARFRH
jgi:hypothetical protein